MSAAVSHRNDTLRRLSATDIRSLGTAHRLSLDECAGAYSSARENALRTLVRAALAGQSIDAVSAGCGLDRSKVGKLLRGALPMTTRMADRLAAAVSDTDRAELFARFDELDRCVTVEAIEALMAAKEAA